jgi:hypothetical protein
MRLSCSVWICVFRNSNLKRSRKSSWNFVWLRATKRYQIVVFNSMQSIVMTWWNCELCNGTKVTYFRVLKRCAVPQLTLEILICKSYWGEVVEYVKNQDGDWKNISFNQSSIRNRPATGFKYVNMEQSYKKCFYVLHEICFVRQQL